MARKPFDANLYERNDGVARKWIRQAMPPEYEVVDNSTKTGVDLLAYKDGELQFYIEPEIKRVWKGDFKYNTLHLPIRKSKYCYLDKPTLFVIFRSDGKEFFCFWSKVVLKHAGIKEVSNKYVRSGELFFNLPVHMAKKSIDVALRQHWRETEDV